MRGDDQRRSGGRLLALVMPRALGRVEGVRGCREGLLKGGQCWLITSCRSALTEVEQRAEARNALADEENAVPLLRRDLPTMDKALRFVDTNNHSLHMYFLYVKYRYR